VAEVMIVLVALVQTSKLSNHINSSFPALPTSLAILLNCFWFAVNHTLC